MALVCSRSIVAVFWFATAAYCLLAATPFVSEQFLKPGLAPALVTFAEWHSWISFAALTAAAVALRPWLLSLNRGACALMAGWGLVTIVLFITDPLPRLEPTTTTLVLALLSLVPPVWMSLIDVKRPRPAIVRFDRDPDNVSRDFAACIVAALVVAMMHAIAPLPLVLPFGGWSTGLAGARSLLAHLVAFSAIFALICVVRGASRIVSTRDAVEAWGARLTLACALAVFIFSIVLRPISLTGARGIIVATAFGTALALTFGPRSTNARPGVGQALGGLVPAWATRSAPYAIAWLVAMTAAIWAVERRAAVSDWNFTIAKSAALLSWLLALAASLRVVRIGQRDWGPIPFLLCFALLGLNAAASRVAPPSSEIAEVWKGHDPSVRLIADVLAPVVPARDRGLEDFLERHTNIPRSIRVDPVAIDLAVLQGDPAPARPHIFLFVIDSLRRDYLSPYNKAVAFTPAFERFARESTVFERAFTRYGATGLSVPAIWIGGLLLHKQYVTPFGPMNALAKLLEYERYEQWIAMDNILDVILPPSNRRAALDAGIQVADYRLCRTLGEIRGRFSRLKDGGSPAFVYALPQDIHVSAITREGAAPLDGESYGTFYAPYASRVRRMDRCFGEFIDALKAHGLFDRSIVIVTSDHGDSLGEQGRMGHAYTLFPEIVQVPLIVHLPPELNGRVRADTARPAFTTDLTPTLYALLGHEPQRPAAFFGRPLFHDISLPGPPGLESKTRPTQSMAPEMLASSYGSVYGILMDGARRLYVIDAINRREHSYDLDGSGPGRPVPIGNDDRARSQRAIRATVEGIAEFYGFRP